MATIYDIAKHVGVSAGTVSRALSRPDKVLPATRARIEQAAAALGYVPNTVARTLKTQRSGKILVTVPDIANPFFAQILQGRRRPRRRWAMRSCWAIPSINLIVRSATRRCSGATRPTA